MIRDDSAARDHYRRLTQQRQWAAGLLRQRSALRVYGQMRVAIRRGFLRYREQLVERQLVTEYATSRNAVREAMALLAEEGLVSRHPRRGTIVTHGIAGLALEDASPAAPPLDDLGDADAGDVLLIEAARVPSTPLLQSRLRTDSAYVCMTEWVTRWHGTPFAVYTNFWVDDSARNYAGKGSAKLESGWREPGAGLVAFLRTYGSPLARIDTTVESVMCDLRTQRTLDLEERRPLLFRERLLWDAEDRPREYNHTFFVGSQIALETTIFPKIIAEEGEHD